MQSLNQANLILRLEAGDTTLPSQDGRWQDIEYAEVFSFTSQTPHKILKNCIGTCRVSSPKSSPMRMAVVKFVYEYEEDIM